MKSDRKSCRNQSKSIKFVTSCAGHVEVLDKVYPNLNFEIKIVEIR